VLAATSCLSPRNAEQTRNIKTQDLLFVESGKASFYAESFEGKKTANGEEYDPEEFTAAHPSLPFGTLLLVKRKSSSRFVLVRVNDRGPFRGGRKIDLSRAAAAKLGILLRGVSPVDIFIIPERSHLAAML
jgi:rare lipoprotein A